MKTLLIGVLAGMVMSLASGMEAADDQFRGREFAQDQRSESGISGTVEKLPDGLVGTWQEDGSPCRCSART